MTEPKITKLPRSGPKDGQSTASYLRSRRKDDKKWETVAEIRQIDRDLNRYRRRKP